MFHAQRITNYFLKSNINTEILKHKDLATAKFYKLKSYFNGTTPFYTNFL